VCIAGCHCRTIGNTLLLLILLFLFLSLLLLLLLLFLGLAFAGLDTPLPLLSQVISSRPRDDRDCPRGNSPPTGLGHFRGLYPVGALPSYAPTPSTNWNFYLTFWALPPRPFTRMLRWGLAPSDCCSRGFAPRATCPLPWPPGLDTPVFPPSWLQHSCKNDLGTLLDHTVPTMTWP
jgi:hypothetical protein